MKRKTKVLLATIIVVAVGVGLYKYTIGFLPGERAVNSYLAEKRYEKHSIEDKIEFGSIPLTNEAEEQEIKSSTSLASSFFSTHSSGSWGYLHVFVKDGKDIVPEKAKMEDYYLRLSEDDDLSCFTFGNVPSFYAEYKNGQAKAYTGGLGSISWYWGTDTPSADLIFNFQSKKVLVKGFTVNQSCASAIE